MPCAKQPAHGKQNGPSNSKRCQNVSRVTNVWHTAKKKALPCASLCRVFFFTSPRSMKDFYRASNLYRVSFYGAHGKGPICRVLYLFRVLQFGYTAKALFTVCPRYSTRQSLRHTANTHSPVVQLAIYVRKTKQFSIFSFSALLPELSGDLWGSVLELILSLVIFINTNPGLQNGYQVRK